MKKRKLALAFAVKLWFFNVHADAQCPPDQQDVCRLAVADLSLPASGFCEAKEYVAFTHSCFRRLGHPVVDYCCCSHPQDGAVMCCRYVQAWNHYRCVESTDRINATSVKTELNLPVVLPSVFITLGVLLTCLLCCLLRCCCNSHGEEGKRSSNLCLMCNCGMMDDSDIKSQNCSPAAVPRSETRVTNASYHHTDTASPDGVFCLCRPRQALGGATVGAVGSPYSCPHTRGPGAPAWGIVPPRPSAPNLEENLPCLTISMPSQLYNDVTQRYYLLNGEENSSYISTPQQLNQEMVTHLLPAYTECSREATILTLNSCDVCSPHHASLSSSDGLISPPSYEECITSIDPINLQGSVQSLNLQQESNDNVDDENYNDNN